MSSDACADASRLPWPIVGQGDPSSASDEEIGALRAALARAEAKVDVDWKGGVDELVVPAPIGPCSPSALAELADPAVTELLAQLINTEVREARLRDLLGA